MKYNNGYKYNFRLNNGGLGYNGIKFRIIINLYDAINMSDFIRSRFAVVSVFERIMFNELIANIVFHSDTEEFVIEDSKKNFVLFSIFENLKIKDVISNIFVALYINDKFSVLDEIKQLNTIISTDEKFYIDEISDVNALISISEKYKLQDAKSLFSFVKENESFYILDREPKKAISDFVIGKTDDLDNAFDWIVPFDMMIDWKNSTIQVMPQTESNYIEMPGVDGSIPEYTVYKNRIFNIVAYSQEGLTIYEKEQLKKEIARILDSTKNQTKKLTFQSSNTSFDVKYSGAADISEGPSFVKAIIPFEAGPYGYPLFEQEISGSGLLVNSGATDIGPVNYISSGAVNPSFQIGNIIYTWHGTVPLNNTLVIDHESYMCYLKNNFDLKTNAITNLTGDFQKIPKESSVAITAFGNTGNYLTTKLKERILW